MIHLTTGAPGAGKTLFTVSWVRELQQKTGRPVCFTSQLRLKGEGLNWGWKQVDIQKWDDEPDGTIFIVDEAQFAFRKGGSSTAPPSWIENLSLHRHKGYDFFLITQDPMFLHTFIRGLIASPGWHRHIKRKFGSKLAAVLEWESFYGDAKDLTSGTTANSVVHKAYPTSYFDKYESTSIDTATFRIPRAFWLVCIGFLTAAALLFYAFSRLSMGGKEPAEPEPAMYAATGINPASGLSSSLFAAPGQQQAPVYDYIAARTPRIPDFPHTAPVYDEITKPVTAPVPAACMAMGERCECYSQQGTKVATSADVCRQIVKSGYFVDWAVDGSGGHKSDSGAVASAAAAAQATHR